MIKITKWVCKDFEKKTLGEYHDLYVQSNTLLLAETFEWIKDTFQFNEDFIKNYNEENDEGYFLEVHVQYLEKLHELNNDLQAWANCTPDADRPRSGVQNLYDAFIFLEVQILHFKKEKK